MQDLVSEYMQYQEAGTDEEIYDQEIPVGEGDEEA